MVRATDRLSVHRRAHRPLREAGPPGNPDPRTRTRDGASQPLRRRRGLARGA